MSIDARGVNGTNRLCPKFVPDGLKSSGSNVCKCLAVLRKVWCAVLGSNQWPLPCESLSETALTNRFTSVFWLPQIGSELRFHAGVTGL